MCYCVCVATLTFRLFQANNFSLYWHQRAASVSYFSLSLSLSICVSLEASEQPICVRFSWFNVYDVRSSYLNYWMNHNYLMIQSACANDAAKRVANLIRCAQTRLRLINLCLGLFVCTPSENNLRIFLHGNYFMNFASWIMQHSFAAFIWQHSTNISARVHHFRLNFAWDAIPPLI